MINNHLKPEFQRLLKLAGPDRDSVEGWQIQVNERFTIQCRFAGANFMISSVLGETKKLKNKKEAFKELLQNMTRNLPTIREVLSINPDDGYIVMSRTLRQPIMLAQLESALADFVNTIEFLEPLYQNHAN